MVLIARMLFQQSSGRWKGQTDVILAVIDIAIAPEPHSIPGLVIGLPAEALKEKGKL